MLSAAVGRFGGDCPSRSFQESGEFPRPYAPVLWLPDQPLEPQRQARPSADVGPTVFS
jgi:hypothetical protein